MISAFGDAANAFAARLDDIDAIIAESATIGPAYIEAVRRRERGETFYGMVLFDDRRIAATYSIAGDVIAHTPDPDQRDQHLGNIANGTLVVNGKTVSDFFGEDELARLGAYEFYILCDAVLVRSYADYTWVAGLFRDRPAPAMARVSSIPAVPAVERVLPSQPGIVVWAPRRTAEFIALHVAALADIHGEVTCVATGTLAATLPAFPLLAPDDPRIEGVLARATCIVCAEPNDPGDAIAFAQRGYGVVAPLRSGAHEYVAQVQVWDGLFYYQLYGAAIAALGAPARVYALAPAPARIPAPSLTIPDAQAPLVSVIIPTYNRPDMLARVLDCVAAQTYPNVELIVVNDAGSPVDDVVAAHPAAQLIVHETNGGAMVAIETGFRASTGEYVLFLPDDDWLYPDHITRVMNGLLTGGATFAHSSALLRFIRPQADGRDGVYGFNMRTFSRTVNLRDALIASTISVNQCIQHRGVFAEVGWFRNESVVADNEFHTRMLQRYTPVFVPHVTCEFRDHERGNIGRSNDLHGGLKEMYELIHPCPDRPVLAEMRRQTLLNVARRAPGQSPFPPTLTFTTSP